MIRLFLDNKEAELNGTELFDFVYQLEDTNNPTIVKNTYSKSIQIEGTPKNNKIFGDIFRLDRQQEYGDAYSGIYFNPSKRVPFRLDSDGDLIEEGYFQLDSIETSSNHITYNISLYGGLGDFFYSLDYDDEGEKRRLSSMTYGVVSPRLISQNPEDEMTFTVNADTVSQAFAYLPKGDLKKGYNPEEIDMWDWITFMPCNNGKYDDFDNDKCIIRVNDGFGHINPAFSDTKYRTKTDDDGKVYGLFNGCALAELPKEYTEWEMRDLRAYKQRPAVRVRRIIEAITNPINNGGYNVRLDESFFNDNNPYWNDTYMSLPLLDELFSDKVEETQKGNHLILYNESMMVDMNYAGTKRLIVAGDGLSDGEISPFGSDYFSTNVFPFGTDMSAHYTFKLCLNSYERSKHLYIAGRRFAGTYYSSIAVQLVAKDRSGNVIKYSPIINFTNPNIMTSPAEWRSGNPFIGDDSETICGYFVDGEFVDVNSDMNRQFELTINDIPTAGDVQFEVWCYRGWGKNGRGLHKDNGIFFSNEMPSAKEYVNGVIALPTINAYTECRYTDNQNLTNAEVTKDILLGGDDISPADFLLSYTKLFGLYYLKDKHNKTIDIVTRNTFFNGEVENIEDCIDTSQPSIISPLTFDYKWYEMGFETPDTKLSERYKNSYKVDYGIKRINTGYNFSSDVNKLFETNKFKNAITYLEESELFYNFIKDGVTLPSMNVNYYQWKLFNNVGGTDESNISFYVYPYNGGNLGNGWGIGMAKDKDCFAKCCFCNEDGSPTDFPYTLVFRNGIKDILDENGNRVMYQISDDCLEMYTLNDGACFYLSYNSNSFIDSNVVYTYSLPVYMRYKTHPLIEYDNGYINDGGNVEYSLDFGSPREVYCNLQISDESSLYNRFHKAFIEDEYNVNTRKVSCYVKWNHRIDASALRKFYFFSNSYWILNEVEDYVIGQEEPVKCGFIKVNSLDNYTDGQLLK